MFDDIIRFLFVFIFLLAPYALVFFFVFGGRQIRQSDYEQRPQLCESALLYCPMVETYTSDDDNSQGAEGRSRYKFNGTSPIVGDLCYNATNSCEIVEQSGFENFYSLLFSIFRIALVDDSKYKLIKTLFLYTLLFCCQFQLMVSINSIATLLLLFVAHIYCLLLYCQSTSLLVLFPMHCRQKHFQQLKHVFFSNVSK